MGAWSKFSPSSPGKDQIPAFEVGWFHQSSEETGQNYWSPKTPQRMTLQETQSRVHSIHAIGDDGLNSQVGKEEKGQGDTGGGY